MDIKNRANWLRGYLESLSDSDNISKQQVKVLLSKMEELVSAIEEYENDGDDSYGGNNGNIVNPTSPTTTSAADDDLPF